VRQSASIDSDAQRVNTAPAESLPKTASNLPLFGLIGMFSILAAFALKLAYFRS
jgi:LPXTG-motif cell wall-anchored protein